jgi:hypothetical protein
LASSEPVGSPASVKVANGVYSFGLKAYTSSFPSSPWTASPTGFALILDPHRIGEALARDGLDGSGRSELVDLDPVASVSMVSFMLRAIHGE